MSWFGESAGCDRGAWSMVARRSRGLVELSGLDVARQLAAAREKRSHPSIRHVDALEQRVMLANAAPTVSFVPHELVAGPTFFGDAAYDQFGRSVSGAGDVNGDGFADLIVGAFRDDDNGTDSGSAQVLSGIDGSVLHTFLGDAADDFFGRSVSGAGDVNGDGFDDLIVGASGDDDNGSASGSARVFSGVDGSVLHTFLGDGAGDYFGGSVSGAGDVNGDGFDDLIVGAYGDDDNGAESGSARVFSGADGSVLHTFRGAEFDDLFGRSVSGAGDVNGDGFDDLIVGAEGDDDNGSFSGSARVFSGADGSVLHNFLGDAERDFFGRSVSGAGDVNGDGFADLIVGADGDDDNGDFSGSARVFSGADGSVLHNFLGDAERDFFGRSVSGAGDVNGDGFDDLIVGADGVDYNGSNSGSARVFSGVDGSVLHTFLGDDANDRFGRSVSGAGDVNGDGFDDLIVGAYGDDDNGSSSGSARVFLSRPTSAAERTFLGDAAGDRFGRSVSGAGDVNGDVQSQGTVSVTGNLVLLGGDFTNASVANIGGDLDVQNGVFLNEATGSLTADRDIAYGPTGVINNLGTMEYRRDLVDNGGTLMGTMPTDLEP